MKRFSVIALAALLIVALAMPAAALENIFGGYWRTRAYTQQQFSGDNRDESGDLSQVDTRTRLFYTAKINDNLAFINKFEFDAVWGDDDLGDIGADGKVFEIKNSYVDWNQGPVNVKLGIQNFVLNRGFTIDDDASGVKIIWKLADGIYLPFSWLRIKEGYDTNQPVDPSDLNKGDIDSYTVAPLVYLSKDIKIMPTWNYIHSREGRDLALGGFPEGSLSNINAHVFGLNADASFDFASFWFTGAMQAGTAKVSKNFPIPAIAGEDLDLKGWIVALGGDANIGPAAVHGQFFYASGDDDSNFAAGDTDTDLDNWVQYSGESYYWAEIMGYGIFDTQVSNGSPADKVSNIYAGNLGATLKPMDKLSLTFDVWYAALAEDNAAGDDKLGTEVDLKVTYQLVEGLNLDVVGAYLFADDATGDDDPIEVGTRLSISF